ncbi:MAG: metal ABC transporter ATP-binding protein [Candidatus Margulisiibacteriota bacterium]|nr:MAG: hypothetical protein A2X43_00435 [Candidatus Margulisbacteria bacterium GWD2_39_127]OGI04306.1 MAG: hypothetical protein A2X42_05240 [Candidatus Margulisbacteria bacterium GWF2_38_17]OGI11789.1 MAG: hypothetical protein A2X41_11010 [Candidatus Margulisbacteria bacterium GWE2_39_32]PZM79841.1 MAG: metal ABC transporter ATP-binding protein [Candidatus Margulisiibacteriota bacterium]HAR62751.1 metal ABC transporter ATP-binding protein [Candidatus Margulisiibacteriota bacterium]
MYALELENVNYTINNVEILKDVNLKLNEGVFLGVVGPNGAGKTTFLKIILGLLKPSRGSVKIFEAPAHGTKTNIGYLPQRKQFDINFPATAFDVVMMGRYKLIGLFNKPRQIDRDMVIRYLNIVGMFDFKDTQFVKLSGGQQQRVLIARSLVSEPKLVILDEPSTGIDVVAQEYLYHFIKHLKHELSLTVIMVTHDIGTITSYVDEVACMNKTIYVHDKPEKSLTRDILAKVYGENINMIEHNEFCMDCNNFRKGK